MREVYLIGTGSYLPGEPVAFEHIDSVLGSLDEAPARIRSWMKRTAGVLSELLDTRVFHYAIDPDTRTFTDDNISMSVKAARRALDSAGISAGEIDLITYGSAHQHQMPTATVRIQEQLGIKECEEFSIHANCTSAYKALHLALELLKSGRNKTALVLSSSIASSELRAEYYNQQKLDKESLFLRWFLCDGAGAVILSTDAAFRSGFRLTHTYTESIGGNKPSLMYNYRPAYWMNPLEEFSSGAHHLRQKFRNELSTDVFIEPDGSVFIKGLKRMLAQAGVEANTITCFQINMPARHITDSIMDECERIGISRDRFYTRLDSLGYAGPPMVFIALDRLLKERRFTGGDRVASFVTEVSKFMQAGYILQYEPHH